MKQRQSNLEILRILSILMLIAFHYAYKGGFEFGALSGNKLLIDVLYHAGSFGVNCFMLISGYFASRTTFKWTKAALLIAAIEFYLILGRIILALSGAWFPGSAEGILYYFFPVLRARYGFVTIYILIYCLSPYLQRLIRHLSKKEFQILLIAQALIWSVYPTVMMGWLGYTNTETMPCYNRLIWYIFIYLIGVYIHEYGISFVNSLKKALLLSLAALLLILLFILSVEFHLHPIKDIDPRYLWAPNSLPQLILSIGIFSVFLQLSIKPTKWINYVASCSLGIYMLHDGNLQIFLWGTLFRNASHQDSPFLFVYIGFAVVVMFLAGVAVESLRKPLERLLEKGLLAIDRKFGKSTALR